MASPQRKKFLIKIQFVASIFLMSVGAGLLIAGFVVRPAGEIHWSVLSAFGEILTFAGAVFGLDFHYKYKYHEKENNNSSQED